MPVRVALPSTTISQRNLFRTWSWRVPTDLLQLHAFGFFRRSSLDDGEREIPGGSRRFLGLSLMAEIRIPAPEGVLPLFVEHPGSHLQEKMCSMLAPPHLLFLHHLRHPFAHDLIDRRLDETGSD